MTVMGDILGGKCYDTEFMVEDATNGVGLFARPARMEPCGDDDGGLELLDAGAVDDMHGWVTKLSIKI